MLLLVHEALVQEVLLDALFMVGLQQLHGRGSMAFFFGARAANLAILPRNYLFSLQYTIGRSYGWLLWNIGRLC